MTTGQLSIAERARARLSKGRTVFSAPIVGARQVCTRDGTEGVWALTKNPLEVIWHRQVRWSDVQAVLADRVVLSPEDGCEAVDWSGAVLWRREGRAHCVTGSDGRLFEVRDGVLSVIDVREGTGKVLGSPIDGRPAVALRRVLLLVHKGGVVASAFDLEAERVVWTRDFAAGVREISGAETQSRVLLFSSATAADRIVFSHTDHVYGACVDDGSILWRTQVTVPKRALGVQDGRVFVWSTSSPVRMTTFDLSTGDIVREMGPSAPNRLVVLDERNGDILIDRDLAEDGPEFASQQMPSVPALGRRHVVFATDAGLIAVFRLSDGELVWKHRLPDQAWSQTVDGNEIYVPCADGTLLVFECEDGEL
jgi:hypothetical protein